MRTHHRTVAVYGLLVLAIGPLGACGSDAGDATSTANTVETSTTVSEGTSSTLGSTTTTISMVAEPTTTTTKSDDIEIVVEGGEVVSGPERIEAELGSTVMFVVVSDSVDHVHVHGYDIFFTSLPANR